MSIKTDLVCGICKKIFRDPIFLPCHCTICKEHIDDIAKNSQKNDSSPSKIECQFCKEEFDLPSKGFTENTRLKMIIEKSAHLSTEEKDLKKGIESNALVYERLVKELEQKEKEFEVMRYEHFAEIRRSIDLRREALKEKVDRIAADMIQQAKILEENYKKNRAETTRAKHSSVEFQKETENLLEIFQSPNIVLKTLMARKQEHDARVDELHERLAHFKWLNDDLKAYEFEKHIEFDSDFFGYLKFDEAKRARLNPAIYVNEFLDYMGGTNATYPFTGRF